MRGEYLRKIAGAGASYAGAWGLNLFAPDRMARLHVKVMGRDPKVMAMLEREAKSNTATPYDKAMVRAYRKRLGEKR